jgi:hypothetical protein
MSRRSRSGVEWVDGIVRLVCRDGHTVGYLWQFDTAVKATVLLDEHKQNRTALDPDEPLRLSCSKCQREGKRPDLRLGYARAQELAEAQRVDRTRREDVHVLGDKQC